MKFELSRDGGHLSSMLFLSEKSQAADCELQSELALYQLNSDARARGSRLLAGDCRFYRIDSQQNPF